MANPLYAVAGFPRWTDHLTFTVPGGGQDPNYPVTNLGVEPLGQVWRSPDAAPANTKFLARLDQPRAVRLLVLVPPCNFSLFATIRLRLYLSSTLLYDTGAVDFWSEVYAFGSVEWWEENWWTGKYTAAQIKGRRLHRPFWLDAFHFADSILVEINDPTNPDGYVECGLFDVSQATQFSVNPVAPGAQFGFRFRTLSTEHMGGAKSFERREKPRVWQGEISHLPHDEAMAGWFEAWDILDLDTPFVWLQRPSAIRNLPRECWLARSIDPGLAAVATPTHDRIPIKLEEAL